MVSLPPIKVADRSIRETEPIDIPTMSVPTGEYHGLATILRYM